jgi:hypothetical protein
MTEPGAGAAGAGAGAEAGVGANERFATGASAARSAVDEVSEARRPFPSGSSGAAGPGRGTSPGAGLGASKGVANPRTVAGAEARTGAAAAGVNKAGVAPPLAPLVPLLLLFRATMEVGCAATPASQLEPTEPLRVECLAALAACSRMAGAGGSSAVLGDVSAKDSLNTVSRSGCTKEKPGMAYAARTGGGGDGLPGQEVVGKWAVEGDFQDTECQAHRLGAAISAATQDSPVNESPQQSPSANTPTIACSLLPTTRWTHTMEQVQGLHAWGGSRRQGHHLRGQDDTNVWKRCARVLQEPLHVWVRGGRRGGAWSLERSWPPVSVRLPSPSRRAHGGGKGRG